MGCVLGRFASAPSLDDLEQASRPGFQRADLGLKISAALVLPAHVRQDQPHHVVVDHRRRAPGESAECAGLRRKHPSPDPSSPASRRRCPHGARDWRRRRADGCRGREYAVSRFLDCASRVLTPDSSVHRRRPPASRPADACRRQTDRLGPRHRRARCRFRVNAAATAIGIEPRCTGI